MQFECTLLTLFRSPCVSQIHVTFDRLFPSICNKCADVLLSSCLYCSIEAPRVGFVFLNALVWLHLTIRICEIQRDRQFFWCGPNVMGRLYWSNAEGAERIRATILFDGGNEDYGIDQGWNLMKIMWNWDKMTRRVQKALRRKIIAAVNWTPLITVFIRTDKTKWDKVKRNTHSTLITPDTRGYKLSKERHYALQSMVLFH